MLDVLLVYPQSSVSRRRPQIEEDPGRSIPLGLCSLASAVEGHGLSTAVLDTRLYTRDGAFAALKDRLENGVRWLGLSVMTCQVPHALELSRAAKALCRDVLVVWGGAHPTLFPEQTVRDPAVDWVVMGEGEEVLPRILSGMPETEEEMVGLATVEGDDVRRGRQAPMLDPAKFWLPAYHLLDLEAYAPRTLPWGKAARGIDVLTSRGCPYRCAFCPNSFLLGRRWRPLPLESVDEQLEVLRRIPGLETVWFVDDYFFGDIERAAAIGEHLARVHPGVGWEANIRPDVLRSGRVDTALLTSLKSSGCHTLRMGAESGSNRVLEILRKDITVEDIRRGVDFCERAGIVPVCFFMMGVPGESRSDLVQTLAVMAELAGQHRLAVPCGPGVFRPYPGGDLYEQCLKLGLREPTTLAQWAAYGFAQGYLGPGDLPWIEDPALIRDVPFYLFYIQERHHLQQYSLTPLRELMLCLACLRASKRFWRFRLEAGMARGLRRVRAQVTH